MLIFSEMKETGKLLSCEQSVTKLIKLLEDNSFISGKHIDYYDIWSLFTMEETQRILKAKETFSKPKHAW